MEKFAAFSILIYSFGSIGGGCDAGQMKMAEIDEKQANFLRIKFDFIRLTYSSAPPLQHTDYFGNFIFISLFSCSRHTRIFLLVHLSFHFGLLLLR